jgi:tetratricopeptide (TPR) repeat protein
MISLLSALLLYAPAALAQDKEIEVVTDIGKLAKGVVMTVFWVVLAIAVVAAVVLIVRRTMVARSMTKVKSNIDQVHEEIDAYLRKGDHAGAASVYERMGEFEKAAKFYELANQYLKAAVIHENLKRYEKAIDLYIKGGESLKAASLHIRLKNFYEAAKIFKNKGDRIRAAQALEMYGNRLGAAKEYKEAGQYLKAAKLYKELNLYPETAEMFHAFLEDKEVDETTAGHYYMYATFLALSNKDDEAVEVFRKVQAFDPAFRDVAQRIEQLSHAASEPRVESAPEEAPQTEEGPKAGAPISDVSEIYAHATADMKEDADDIESLIEDELAKRDAPPAGTSAEAEDAATEAETAEGDSSSLQRETTLKNMIKSGTLEPSYAMKLWVEVLRKLKVMHDQGQFIGVLSPHTIFIDMENNVRIEPPSVPHSEYLSPEFREGGAADAQTDIYSVGVLLHEMTAGSLEEFGTKNPSQLNKDIPEWVDEFVLRCTESEREHRFKTLDDIYSKLLDLKDQM